MNVRPLVPRLWAFLIVLTALLILARMIGHTIDHLRHLKAWCAEKAGLAD